MNKLKMHSPNLTDGNIARIRELFPGCVTEARDESGALNLAVDFDQLKQELSDSIVEGPQERYHLNWPGKREALLTENAPIAKELVKELAQHKPLRVVFRDNGFTTDTVKINVDQIFKQLSPGTEVKSI